MSGRIGGEMARASAWDALRHRFRRERHRVTVGLALGGGGARGLAHVGVLKVLEEEGVQVDVLAGTSMGGLVAIASAGGLPGRDMLAAAARVNVVRLLGRDRTGLAVASTDRVGAMIVGAVGKDLLEDLPRRCAVVAADAVSGEQVVIDHGPVARAVQATIAIPGLLSPVVDGPRILVDGGIVDPVPVDVARSLGADVVIAVDVSADPRRPLRAEPGLGLVPRRLASSLYLLRVLGRERLVDVLVKAYEIQGARLAQANLQRERPDVLIRPPMVDLAADQFEKAERVIARGEEAARQALPAIRAALAVDR